MANTKTSIKSKTEEKTKATTTTQKRVVSTHTLNMLAYIAVCFGGVALFVAMILSKFNINLTIISAIQRVANAISWVVVSILSFGFIKNRKKTWMWVVWTLAVVMILVGIIL